MCALLPAWTCLLFGLLPLEIQTRAQLSQNVQSTRHRPSKCFKHMALPTSDYAIALDDTVTLAENRFIWRVLRTKEPSPRWFEMEQEAWPSARGRSRGRRHAKSRRTHRQMMRAGCVLGTCQVQNLSHRLYQLIGRRGRHDSSPIDPRSPHSYG
ncbi:uncharacterized protein adm2b [Hippocampus comes]|uniref:uncharacterized protein adm2b n=1 Tax=Hippocampus comes TaxID=109280 RepID=UPI00094EBF21|nr:PREDICTED: ADM2 [Hippocampus comes]